MKLHCPECGKELPQMVVSNIHGTFCSDACLRECNFRVNSIGKNYRQFPRMVAGFEVWPEIQKAVPQTYGEAVALWGTDVVSCQNFEWDNRTTEENACWLLCRLHVRRSLERLKELPDSYPEVQ